MSLLVTYGFCSFLPHVSLFTGRTDIADFTWTARFQLHAALKTSEYKLQAGDRLRLGRLTAGVDQAGGDAQQLRTGSRGKQEEEKAARQLDPSGWLAMRMAAC